jgi:RNA polymerase sigma-70 factor (ECF subfamily)
VRLETFDPARSRFSTWLFTIARNRCINAMKKKRPVCIDRLPEGEDPCHPAERAAERELLARLDTALETLPAGQRRAFILAEFEALPYEQIAQIEGIRIGTIRSRISRARRRLAEILKRYGMDRQ